MAKSRLDQWKPVSTVGVNPGVIENVREDIRRHFWAWYLVHKDDLLARVRILFWSKSIYVRDIRKVFVMLFGDEPTT